MNNFNCFFETLLDGSKYIYIRKSLNREKAQEYCSEKYENGTLCGLKDKVDWDNDFTDSTRCNKQEPKAKQKKYWTGLMRATEKNGNFCYDGTCTDFAENEACEASCQWQDDQCHCFYMQGGKFCISSCTESNYFICQVNKGNKIYR
jgi:hypothetical protein